MTDIWEGMRPEWLDRVAAELKGVSRAYPEEDYRDGPLRIASWGSPGTSTVWLSIVATPRQAAVVYSGSETEEFDLPDELGRLLDYVRQAATFGVIKRRLWAFPLVSQTLINAEGLTRPRSGWRLRGPWIETIWKGWL